MPSAFPELPRRLSDAAIAWSIPSLILRGRTQLTTTATATLFADPVWGCDPPSSAITPTNVPNSGSQSIAATTARPLGRHSNSTSASSRHKSSGREDLSADMRETPAVTRSLSPLSSQPGSIPTACRGPEVTNMTAMADRFALAISQVRTHHITLLFHLRPSPPPRHQP